MLLIMDGLHQGGNSCAVIMTKEIFGKDITFILVTIGMGMTITIITTAVAVAVQTVGIEIGPRTFEAGTLDLVLEGTFCPTRSFWKAYKGIWRSSKTRLRA